MSNPKIIVHCLVKNEERFIYYALKSVLPYVDKIMVWDTGSTDNTLQIIKSIKSKKISLKQVEASSAQQHTKLRQQMLDQTPKSFAWLMILDGDEVWPEKSIKKATQFARKNPKLSSIVIRTHNLVGDIYHRLPESAGHYQIAGHKGHLALRFMNLKTIPGLHVSLPHGQQGFFDGQNTLVQNRDPKKIKLLNVFYHHATHLTRSPKDTLTLKRSFKKKIALGTSIPNYQVPKVFFAPKPKIVPTVTQKAAIFFWLKAIVITPVRLLKRCLFSSPSGY